MAVDWLAIRNDYINGGGSYRKLAEQYGVSIDTVKRKAAAEKWKDARTKHTQNVHQKVQEETASMIVQREIKRVERLLSISDKLIDKIERAVQELDQVQVANKTKTKVIEYNNRERPDKPTKEIVEEREEILAVASIVDRKGLQQVSTALKVAWEIVNEGKIDDPEEVEDDGLLEALGKNAKALFADGDDSHMVPDEPEEEE